MPEPHLRAADADRAAVATQLGEQMSAGRLTVAEYDERLARAYAARTYGELEALTADLPRTVAQTPAPAPAPAPGTGHGATACGWSGGPPPGGGWRHLAPAPPLLLPPLSPPALRPGRPPELFPLPVLRAGGGGVPPPTPPPRGGGPGWSPPPPLPPPPPAPHPQRRTDGRGTRR